MFENDLFVPHRRCRIGGSRSGRGAEEIGIIGEALVRAFSGESTRREQDKLPDATTGVDSVLFCL